MLHSNRTCRLLIATLFLTGWSAQSNAQDNLQSGCEIGVDCAPDAVSETQSTSNDDAPPPPDPSLSKNFATVWIAESIGEDRAAVEAIVRANTNVRLANSRGEAEFLIAPYPDFPDTLILMPRPTSNPESRLQTDEELAYRFASFGERGDAKLPPVIGRLDDNTLASGLNAEIQKTLWSRRILAKPIPRLRSDVTTEIFGPDSAVCNGVGESRKCEQPYWVVARNQGSEPVFVALMRIDQDFPATDTLTRLKDQTQIRLDPGEAKLIEDDAFEDVPEADSRHIVTIASNEPIDLSIFDTQQGPMPSFPKSWTATTTYVPLERRRVRIGGGFRVANLATPWQVQLYSTESSTPPSLLAAGKINWQLHEKTHRCGGSLIEPNIVLTAAHCIANAPFDTAEKRQTVFKYRRVKLGTKDLTRGGTTFAVDAVIVKKGYVPGGNHHDIALVRIKSDASTVARAAALAQRIPLASKPPVSGNIVSAFGWGVMEEVAGRNTRISSAGAAQRNPAELRTGDLQILDQQTCRTRPGYGHVSNLMLCAVTPRNSEAARQGRHVFTCLGDSGGPIMSRENGRMVQVGVVSWAVGCGVNDNPSVSVNVAAYLDWINANKTKFETGKSIER